MYAVKIDPGKERIRVRHYRDGFLPSYVSSAESDMGKRMLVVPGYVFTMTKVSGAEKVPEQEWALIEAISDKKPSVLDVISKKIIDGPLKDLLILHINPALKTVCIRARLLGIARDYWLAVKFGYSVSNPRASENQTEGQPEDNNTTKIMIVEENNMDMNILFDRAKEIGMHAAAAEAGIPWQKIMHAAKKAGVEIPRQKTVRKATVTIKTAENPSQPEPKSREPEKADQPAEAPAQSADTEIEPNALEIENAVLRAENEKLRARIEKLKKALAELI